MESTKSYTQNYLKIVDEQRKRIEDNMRDIKHLETAISNAGDKIYDEIDELYEDIEIISQINVESDNSLMNEKIRILEDNNTNIKYLESIIDKAFQQVYDEIFELEEDTEMAIETITKAGEKYFVMKSIIEDDAYGDL